MRAQAILVAAVFAITTGWWEGICDAEGPSQGRYPSPWPSPTRGEGISPRALVGYLPSRMKSAARSAIIMMVALVLARTMSGITAASMTRRFCRPWTLQY